jgi:WD40 repeat protein
LTVMLFPDGKTLAAGDKAGNLMMWDLETGTEKFRTKAHEAQINALTLSPDGKTLVSCAHDGTVRLWHAGPEF